MLKTIRYELEVMFHKKEFGLSFLLMMAVAVWGLWASYASAMESGMTNPTNSWCPETLSIIDDGHPLHGVLVYLTTFVLVLPHCHSYINDYEAGLLPIVIGRCGSRNYYWAKQVSCFIGSFIVILLPFLFNLLMCRLAFPHSSRTGIGTMGTVNYDGFGLGSSFSINMKYQLMRYAGAYFTNYTLYAIIYILQLAFTCGVFGMLLMSLSFLCRKLRYFLLLPVFVLMRITQTLGQSFLIQAGQSGHLFINHSLADYLFIGSYPGQSPWFLLILYGAVLLLVFFTSGVVIHNDHVVFGGGQSPKKGEEGYESSRSKKRK